MKASASDLPSLQSIQERAFRASASAIMFFMRLARACRGVQVDIKDAVAWTPLFYAARATGNRRIRASRSTRKVGGGVEAVKTLLDAGADVTYFSVIELYYRAPRFLAAAAKDRK